MKRKAEISKPIEKPKREKVTAKESLQRLKRLREQRREWVAQVKKTLSH
jgi:hypothetical protein